MKPNKVTIKAASPNHASDWAEMLVKLDEETEFTKFESGERPHDITKYRDKINSLSNSPKSALFFAIDNSLEKSKIVGYLIIEAFKNSRKNHVATVGVGVLQSHRKAGVAIQLCREIKKHVYKVQIRRIEAHIAESNYRSIMLAKKFGFQIEAIKRNAIRINNIFRDEYLMVAEVEPAQQEAS